MASNASVVALAALLSVWTACRASAPGALDSELASCLPPDAQALAGIHLDQVRVNPMLRKLSADWLPLVEPARDASFVLIGYTGKDLLVVEQGQFPAAPPGATLLDSRLAVAGPAALVRAARTQHAAGRTGAPALVARATAIASQPIWAIAAGGVPLPLSGNAANLNQLLALTDYTTFALELNSGITLHFAGTCRSAERAQQLEETLRGLISLAGAASREPDLLALLASVQIRRADLTVRADTSGSPEVIERLLRSAAR